MKRIALFAGLAFVLAAQSFAQDVPTPAPASDTLSATGHSTTVYHGPHNYPMIERGHQPGDPPIIDHRADSLLVEPTHSTITILPTP